jgi:very-short-patch-repair endonuclease
LKIINIIMVIRDDINTDNIVKLYETGNSVKKISEILGCSKPCISGRLKGQGIVPRNRSEAMLNRMSHSTPEERARLTDAAHSAVRGMCRTEQDLCKRARGKEDPRFATRIELKCADMLREHGFEVVLQKAIGSYNIDIAIPKYSIAVEIYGGNWHSGGRAAARFRKRFDYLINAGWFPVIIWVVRDYPLEVGAIDYLITLAEKISSGESVIRKEQMIWGNGNACCVGKRNLDDRS